MEPNAILFIIEQFAIVGSTRQLVTTPPPSMVAIFSLIRQFLSIGADGSLPRYTPPPEPTELLSVMIQSSILASDDQQKTPPPAPCEMLRLGGKLRLESTNKRIVGST